MAVAFSGTAQYYSKPSALITAYPWSFACWAISPGISTSEQGLICVDLVANTYYVFLEVIATNQVSMQVNFGGTNTIVGASTTFTNNVWFHAAYVQSAEANATVYLNGGSAGNTVGDPGVFQAMTATRIGTENQGSGFSAPFNGSIAEAAIWNVALTASDIASLAAAISPKFIRRSNLVMYSPLWSAIATPQDLVSSATWTVTGAPVSSAHPRIYGG